MKSSKKCSRAVVTVVACILAVCLVAALVLFSLVNSKVRALQKGAAFEFSYNITAQDSASTPALYNILKQVGATSGDVAGLYSPGQLQLYLYPSGGLARAETGGTDFFTDLYIDANDTYFDAGRLYRTLRDSIADSAPGGCVPAGVVSAQLHHAGPAGKDPRRAQHTGGHAGDVRLYHDPQPPVHRPPRLCQEGLHLLSVPV